MNNHIANTAMARVTQVVVLCALCLVVSAIHDDPLDQFKQPVFLYPTPNPNLYIPVYGGSFNDLLSPLTQLLFGPFYKQNYKGPVYTKPNHPTHGDSASRHIYRPYKIPAKLPDVAVASSVVENNGV